MELGGAPFALTTDAAVEVPAAELGLLINPGGRIYVLPCIAGHVGADTAGMILSEEPQEQEQMTLARRRGHQCRDCAGQSPPPPGLLQSHRASL